MGDAHVRGEVVSTPLKKLKPNGWNPNVVTPEKMASIEHGFRTDGWLASQALLVWRKDDAGKVRNVIIDGEHRWKAAKAVGMTDGPAVFLDGLTEGEAKALTVKLNQKRGEWDEDALAGLLAELGGSADMALDLGFTQDELDSLIGAGGDDLPPAGTSGSTDAPAAAAIVEELAAFEGTPPAETSPTVVFRMGKHSGQVPAEFARSFEAEFAAVRADRGDGVLLEDVLRRWRPL